MDVRNTVEITTFVPRILKIHGVPGGWTIWEPSANQLIEDEFKVCRDSIDVLFLHMGTNVIYLSNSPYQVSE